MRTSNITPSAKALIGSRIFTGQEFLDDHAVILKDRHILRVCRGHEVQPEVEMIVLNGGLLAPGFIDVQVNGGGGALLNDNPTQESVKHIALSHRKFGTTGLLPTVITDAPSVIDQAISAVRATRQELPQILGLHIEGPFIDIAKKGAHDSRFIRTLTSEDTTHLLNCHCGQLMVTVAPNTTELRFIEKLAKAGVLVSLGHADASFAQAKAALASGAKAFTHLFNAMSQMTAREPGMVGAALSDKESFIGIIVDGFHVAESVLKIALAATSHDRFMLISDAMPSAAGGPKEFSLQGRQVKLAQGRLTLSDGTLAGSHLTLDEALRNCVQHLGISLADGLRMASFNPAKFMGLDNRYGRIAPGYVASLVHLDDRLYVQGTWVEGR